MDLALFKGATMRTDKQRILEVYNDIRGFTNIKNKIEYISNTLGLSIDYVFEVIEEEK